MVHSPLRGGAAGAGTIAHTRRRRNRPAADYADGGPLGVVGHSYYHSPVVSSHVGSQLVPVRKTGGRAAPGNTKMLD